MEKDIKVKYPKQIDYKELSTKLKNTKIKDLMKSIEEVAQYIRETNL